MRIKKLGSHASHDLAFDVIEKSKQSIVFVESKQSAEKTAEEIARLVRKYKKKNEALRKLADDIRDALGSPTKQCIRLAECVEQGIAFHHAGLVAQQRELIEDAFRKGVITTICATPTLCLSPHTNVWHGVSETTVSALNVSHPLLVLSNNSFIHLKPEHIQRNLNLLKLVQIKSVSGYSIDVTPSHKMLIKRNNEKIVIPAEKIRLTDRIATIGKINIDHPRNPTIKDFVAHDLNYIFDPQLSYFIGAMLGDGYSGASGKEKMIIFKSQPMIVGRDPEIFNTVKDVCVKLNISTRAQNSYHGVPQLIMGKNKWFRTFLVNCGIEQRDKKYISEKLMIMNSDNIVSLLRGLFDTDGYVRKNVCVGISSVSEQLIRQIQKLLLRFGIVSFIRKRNGSVMNIYNKEYKTLPCFELSIFQNKSIVDFYRYVGFNLQRKQDTLLELVSKIISNVRYISCNSCHYKIYKDIFSGRTKDQQSWGLLKLNVINTLGSYGELSSNKLKNILEFTPRAKENRLNHHYELIKKRKIGTISKTEWFWSLNQIGAWIYHNLIKDNKSIIEFFKLRNCPLCNTELHWIVKKTWRSSDFDGDLFWDKVKSVTEVESQPEVYDVVLPHNPQNDHMFVANGFVVHNSYGVDTPAYRVIMKTLKRYGTGSWGMNWIPVLDYLQCAGRAGRPNFHDDYGEAIAIAKNDVERDEIVAQYVHGKPESIFSKLAVEPVLRTYVLSLIAIGFARTKQQLITFFGKTFWAHQYKDMIQLERIIDKMLLLLDKWGFILQNKLDDFVSADELGKDQTIRATPLGKRVAELYLDPFTAFHLIKGMRTLKEKMYSDFGILQLISCTLEMRPLLRMRVKDHEFVQAALLEHYSDLLMMEPSTYDPTYDDFVDSVKTALFFIEWIDEKTEEELLEMFNIRPGESRTKISNADWLLYGLSELLPLMNMHERVADIKRMRIRVQYGAKEELLTLLRLDGVGRVRARKLHRNGLKDLGALKKVDELTLSSIVGKAIAQKIKKQLGEENDVVLGVRKGQMGLAKYDAE